MVHLFHLIRTLVFLSYDTNSLQPKTLKCERRRIKILDIKAGPKYLQLEPTALPTVYRETNALLRENATNPTKRSNRNYFLLSVVPGPSKSRPKLSNEARVFRSESLESPTNQSDIAFTAKAT